MGKRKRKKKENMSEPTNSLKHIPIQKTSSPVVIESFNPPRRKLISTLISALCS